MSTRARATRARNIIAAIIRIYANRKLRPGEEDTMKLLAAMLCLPDAKHAELSDDALNTMAAAVGGYEKIQNEMEN